MQIKTERCLIRPFKEKDIADFMSYRNDLDWMQYQGFKGLNKQAYMQVLLKALNYNEGVQLAIIDNQLNTLIGDIYLKQDDDCFWLGYTICRAMSKQGYAFECVSAILNTLKKQGVTCVKAGVITDNLASIALLEKLQFVYEGIEGDEQIFVRIL